MVRCPASGLCCQEWGFALALHSISSSLRRRTGHERRPVNSLLKILVWLESLFEGECKLRGPVLLQMRKAFGGFVHAGTMSRRDPPQCGISTREFFEPRFPLPEQFCVRSLINVMAQGGDTLPHRHVD